MAQPVSERALTALRDLTVVLQAAEGFSALMAALNQGRSGTVDGTWGSSSALVAATLSLQAPRTIVTVIAHPGDVDSWVDDLTGFAGEAPAIFPPWEQTPAEELLADKALGQRLHLLKLLQQGQPPRQILTTIQALMQPVPSPDQLARQRRRLQTGAEVRLEELVTWLVEHGFTRREVVELPAEFSRRGGILDIFPLDAEAPYRLEFFGDELESIRQFAPETQRSLGEVEDVEITAPVFSSETSPSLPGGGGSGWGGSPRASLLDYLPSDAWIALIEPADLHEQGKHYLERTADVRGLLSVEAAFKRLFRFPTVAVSSMPTESMETTCHLRVESVERFSGDVNKVREELQAVAAHDQVLIACHNDAERKRLGELLFSPSGDGAVTPSPPHPLTPSQIRLLLGRVRAGFRIVDAGIVVLSDQELFHRQEPIRSVAVRRRYEARAIDSFLDLAENDLVVHVSHGIARYRGLQVLEKLGQVEEHLVLEFADGVKLYVPVSKIDLVQKYIGGPHSEPRLSKLGGTSWDHRKQRAQAAVLDLAGDMIELQAIRESQPGILFPGDNEWQAQFEAAFSYEETPDQLTTLTEIKTDMERPRPMDRLICGDVGYGKTELAVRAAFKAIDFGKQVAVLVPTTVLAEQHYRTFSSRLAEYPFIVESLSRFRSGAEQKDILKRLGEAKIDIIIGTHRLLSADVQFRDLGLVIIDEEQRFGVEHKERLKKLRHTVDVLTLTATPIPRTLHLSLLGVRDISNLETPPRDRLAIETRITRFDPTLIRHAILRELNRDGQVYFVHNRVYNIQAIANRVQEIVPEARLSIAHGQMPEHELEEAMLNFVQRKSDILVATTIIESGLDIPNVNTIFINQADQYGLADLHQLRGRVGRYKHRAYCYLLLDGERGVTPAALKRLKAIEEFTELGAGFKIAMRDLEIRGAGNILGTQQSGHIAAIGYELYCQLLEGAVRRLKNQPLRTSLDVTLDLPWRAFLPRDYVPGQRLKIEVYRRLARIRKLERIDEFRQELKDRFGPVPEPAEWLLRLQELRLLAARWQIATMHFEKQDLVLGYRNRKRVDRLAGQSGGRLRVVDAQSAYYRLQRPELEPERLYKFLKTLLQSPVRPI